MSWVAAGTAAAVVVGGLIQSDANSSAANKQQAATKAGIDASNYQYQTTRKDQEPYRITGTSSLARLNAMVGNPALPSGLDLDRYGSGIPIDAFEQIAGYYAPDDRGRVMDALSKASLISYERGKQPENYGGRFTRVNVADTGDVRNILANGKFATNEAQPDAGVLSKTFTTDDFWNDPVVKLSYQSGLDLGTKALKNAAPLTTGLDSGAALKELIKFGTDYAGSKASESFGRFEGLKTNVFNRLASMAGLGQTANQVNAAAGTANAANVSNMLTAQGNADAAARMQQGNAWSGALSNLSNWWNQRAMMDQFNSGRGSGSTSTYNYNANAPS